MLNAGILKEIDGLLDEEGYFIPSSENISIITMGLKHGHTILIPFNAGDMTQYDILLSYGAFVVGNPTLLQGGLKLDDLFVSIIRKGSFGFKIGQTSSNEYYMEKLGVGSSFLLTEVLNEIRMTLNLVKTT